MLLIDNLTYLPLMEDEHWHLVDLFLGLETFVNNIFAADVNAEESNLLSSERKWSKAVAGPVSAPMRSLIA